jgi:hypothetical protein
MLNPVALPDGCDILAEDWPQLLTSGRQQLFTLLKRAESPVTHINRDSTNSRRPPSIGAPAKTRASGGILYSMSSLALRRR